MRENTIDDDRFLTPQQVAEYLQLQPRTVARMCFRGELPAVKFGTNWRISERKLVEWLDESAKKIFAPAGVAA